MASIHIIEIVSGKDITKDIIAGIENGTAALRIGKDSEVRVIRNGQDITSNIIFGIDNE